jgi:NAD(P)-dependent dehydrogenase (short-subunit alcohol dehydrogenase family)
MKKTIIVTGAASGIGAETAKQLKILGHTIIAFDRNEPKENIDQYIPIDLSDEDSIKKAVSEFKGKAHALCNIAGLPPTIHPELQIKVNFFGLRLFTQLLIEKLHDGASIINLASVAGSGWMRNLDTLNKLFKIDNFAQALPFLEEHNISDEATYNFSKEAVILWTLYNATTWSDRNITIKALSPGPVKTPILQSFMDTIAKKQVVLPEAMKGEPEKIAAIVTFLCGENASWINGQNIVADGGLSAMRMTKQLST